MKSVASIGRSRSPHRLLGAARRSLLVLEGPGEREKVAIRLVEIDRLTERLTNLERRRVVQLDPVVLGIVEVDAACDPMGDRPVDLDARVAQPVIVGADVVEGLYLER